MQAALQPRAATAAQLVPLVYPQALPRALKGAAAWNVFQHLDKLAAEGAVRCLDPALLERFRGLRDRGGVPMESSSWTALRTKHTFVQGTRFAS